MMGSAEPPAGMEALGSAWTPTNHQQKQLVTERAHQGLQLKHEQVQTPAEHQWLPPERLGVLVP